MTPTRLSLVFVLTAALWGCGAGGQTTPGPSGGGAAGSAGVAGAGGSGAGGTAGADAGGGASGSAGAGGSSPADAGSDSSLPPRCTVLLEIHGLAHQSTSTLLKKTIPIPESAPTSWQSIRVQLDVYLADWTPKQGQYEVFTLLRGHKWVSGAIGYVAFIGPAQRQTVMVANLNLPNAAGKDGRRIAKSYAYQTQTTYHLDYVYDVGRDLRQVIVSSGGTEVTRVTGKVSVPLGNPPVTSIDVPQEGFTFLMGGEQIAGAPDAATLGWKFSNVRIVGCH